MSDGKEKSWQARLSRTASALTTSFVESISLDRRLWKHDIAGSLAHARMLAKVGLIGEDDLQAIEQGFAAIRREIEAGTFRFDPAYEDIHMVLEAALIERIGEPGKKLHTARSRNDQVSLDMRLWMREAIDEQFIPKLVALQRALLDGAERHAGLIMPAYTHLQPAQPVCVGAYLLAFVEMFQRDRERLDDCRRRVDVCPLGCGAVAGTSLPIDRAFVAEQLGFARMAANSIDATADRDFCVEYVACCATCMMHLSRLAEDWILFSSQEFGFLRIDDAYCTSSSMMPQKRNADLLELIRGRTGRVFGALTGLLTMLKGTPLAYNRDMQEDKLHVFGAHDTLVASLEVAEAVVRHSRFCEDRLRRAAEDGYTDATALAEYLVRKGVPFREAHRITGRLVLEAEKRGQRLGDLSLETLRAACKAIGEDVFEHLGPENVVARYSSEGSGGRRSVDRQIAAWKARLAADGKHD